VKARDLLIAVAVGFLAFIAVATVQWLKSAAGLGAAIAGSWRTATSDWMVLLFLCDGLVFGTLAIGAMGWDLRREPRRCAAWVLTALLIGSPVVLIYLWKEKRGGSLAAPAP
jgi:hypothetical protein